MRHGMSGEFAAPGTQGWAEWTQEDKAHGTASLKFTRPLNRITDWKPPYPEIGRDTLETWAPPVRLPLGGKYRLRCKVRGTATHADLRVVSGTGTVHTYRLSPSSAWSDYSFELELPAGYTLVKVHFGPGGADDQILWLDDLFLAPAPQ